jgi:hypothetical protein
MELAHSLCANEIIEANKQTPNNIVLIVPALLACTGLDRKSYPRIGINARMIRNSQESERRTVNVEDLL